MSKLTDQLAEELGILGGYLPPHEREFYFARHVTNPRTNKPSMYRFDFAWPEYKLAVEVEGLVSQGISRHAQIAGYREDCRKYNLAILEGWHVLRFEGSMVTRRKGECEATMTIAAWFRRYRRERRAA